jgi:hypothetical protein
MQQVRQNPIPKRVLWVGIAAMLELSMGMGGRAIAQEAPNRPRPTFFEESRRQSRAGFGDSFVNDALNGVADPLGGSGAAGTGSPPRSGGSPAAPRSATPSPPPTVTPPTVTPPANFDRTSVIIRSAPDSGR